MIKSKVALPIAFCLVLTWSLTLAVVESDFAQTPKCLDQNGYCVAPSECTTAQPADKNYSKLCQNGETRNDKAICCKDFPQKELRCSVLHNTCMQGCKPQHDLGRRECKEGTTCCLLVI